MARSKRSRRTTLTFVTLIIFSISVITLDEGGKTEGVISSLKSKASDVISPLHRGVDDVLHPVGGFIAGMFHYGSLESENESLRNQIGDLKEQLSTQQAAAQRLESLESLDHLAFLTGLQSEVAEVTEISNSNFAATIDVDKGRNEGVATGDPVVGVGGLIGHVVESNDNTAVVQLITDGQSRVSVTFGSGKFATLQGNGPGRNLSALFVPARYQLKSNVSMYTSGLNDATFPAGIPVGKVQYAKTIPGEDLQTVSINPFADLNNLTYVRIVQWSPTP